MLFVCNRIYRRDGAGCSDGDKWEGTGRSTVGVRWGRGQVFGCGVRMGINCYPHVTLYSLRLHNGISLL